MSAQRRFHIKRDDVVIAISGEDAAGGKTGKVLRVLRGEGRAIVEGFNLVRRHTRKSQSNPEGGIIEKEAPVAISNLRVHTEQKKKAGDKAPAKK